jgi:hypothetical protein
VTRIELDMLCQLLVTANVISSSPTLVT